ncbi:AaceriABR079Cp [[Ashbya] aceris (nom. inval.)]|nr:AaceriABR079Cp [[Ashbya] aceris (nom. inval.)]
MARQPPAPEPTLEQLDQEITLQLQKIDANLSACFSKITKDIIPAVARYGAVCDDALSACSWLRELFQKSSDIQLATEPSAPAPAPESLFPQAPAPRAPDVTTEGHVLAVPVSSDDEPDDGSTLQRQHKRRKLSLQLQQRYGSSSSSSFVSRSPTLRTRPASSPLRAPDDPDPPAVLRFAAR